MRLLLDTHIWLWALLQPARVADRVTSVLREPDNQLWLSPISVWETLLLIERGRIELGDSVDAWLARAQQRLPVRDASLSREIAIASRAVDLPHQDPADRFLAATAVVEGLTLVTQDAHLLAADEVPTFS